MNKNISEHISYLEATTSQTAVRKKLDNTPNQEQLNNMKLLAEKVFEPLRKEFGPIRISSFFRAKKVNTAVKGSKFSQHITGEAMDLQGLGGVKNSDIFNYIKFNLPFDQLIWEYGNKENPSWVHVSYSKTKNRKQVLHIV